MIWAVHDASILIDLVGAGLIPQTLALGYCMVTTDFIMEELQLEQRSILLPFIATGQFVVEQADELALGTIATLFHTYTSLSFADCSVLFCDQQHSAILLTGDKRLRNVATNHIEVHGILWIVEELLASQLITHKQAIAKLQRIMEKNDRLPKTECSRIIQQWKKRTHV